MNKIVKIGAGVLVAGGIATAIAVPLSNKINHKDPVIDHVDTSQVAWTVKGKDVTIQDVLDQLTKESITSTTLVSSLLKSATFLKYDEEQKGSIELQKQYFEYQKWDLEDEKTNQSPSADRIKAIDEEIKSIDSKLTKLTKLTKADYESSSFASDFPHVLMLKEVIENRQKSILEDSKNAFIKQFATKKDGEAAWINELKTKYNGVTSDDEAVSSLVYGLIKNDSLAASKFRLNNSFTERQKKSNKFTFLANATSKTTNVKDSDKVYFVSTNSKVPSKIYVEVTETSKVIATLSTNTKLSAMSHVLIPAIQNENGYSLPWKITKADLVGGIKKSGEQSSTLPYGLLTKYGTSGSQKSFFELLSANVDDGKGQLTADYKMFVEHATNQPSASKDGLLGIKPKIEQVQGMVPGFALGAIEGMTNTDAATPGAQVIADIKTGLSKFISDNTLTTNDEIAQKVNSMSDDEVTNTFGTIFRDAFGSHPKLSYKIDDHSFIVTSKFGIHIVHVADYSDAKTLSNQIQTDLKNAADKQSLSEAYIDYSTLFARTSTDIKLAKQYLADTKLVAEIEKGYNINKGKNPAEQVGRYFPRQNDDAGKALEWSAVKTNIDNSIKNTESSEVINSVSSALGSSKDSYLLPHYDKNLLDTTTDWKTIYADANKLGGK